MRDLVDKDRNRLQLELMLAKHRVCWLLRLDRVLETQHKVSIPWRSVQVQGFLDKKIMPSPLEMRLVIAGKVQMQLPWEMVQEILAKELELSLLGQQRGLWDKARIQSQLDFKPDLTIKQQKVSF